MSSLVKIALFGVSMLNNIFPTTLSLKNNNRQDSLSNSIATRNLNSLDFVLRQPKKSIYYDGNYIGEGRQAENLNLNGVDLSSYGILEDIYFKNSSFVGSKMPNLKNAVFYHGSNLKDATFKDKVLDNIMFGNPLYGDYYISKDDKKPTFIGANFDNATLIFRGNPFDNPYTIWNTTLNGSNIIANSEPNLKGKQLDLTGANFDYTNNDNDYKVNNPVDVDKIYKDYGPKVRAALGNRFFNVKDKTTTIAFSSDCQTDFARTDCTPTPPEDVEIFKSSEQYVKNYAEFVANQLKMIENLNIIYDDQSGQLYDYKINICIIKGGMYNQKGEYLERRLNGDVYINQILIGNDNYDNHLSDKAGLIHEFGHAFPHRFSHQTENGYPRADFSVMTYAIPYQLKKLSFLSEAEQPYYFYSINYNPIDFSLSELKAFNLVYGGSLNFTDQNVTFNATEKDNRNTVIADGKYGNINFFMKDLKAGQKFAIFNVGRSFGGCKDISQSCIDNDSFDQTVEGYDDSIMIALLSDNGRIEKYHILEVERGSKANVTIYPLDNSPPFKYGDRYSLLSLLDDSKDEVIKKIFNSTSFDKSMEIASSTEQDKTSSSPDESTIISSTPVPETTSTTQAIIPTSTKSVTETTSTTQAIIPTSTKSVTETTSSTLESTSLPETNSSTLESAPAPETTLPAKFTDIEKSPSTTPSLKTDSSRRWNEGLIGIAAASSVVILATLYATNKLMSKRSHEFTKLRSRQISDGVEMV